jgi:hypothetical protein
MNLHGEAKNKRSKFSDKETRNMICGSNWSDKETRNNWDKHSLNMTTLSLNVDNFITFKLSSTNYPLWRE